MTGRQGDENVDDTRTKIQIRTQKWVSSNFLGGLIFHRPSPVTSPGSRYIFHWSQAQKFSALYITEAVVGLWPTRVDIGEEHSSPKE